MTSQSEFKKLLELLISPFMLYMAVIIWLTFDITWEQVKKDIL